MLNKSISRRTAVKGLAIGGTVLGTEFPAIAAPKRGGKIRIGLSGGSITDSYDPQKNAGLMHGYIFLVYNRLVQEVSDTGELKPELATSWESSNFNRDWVFNLRKGVKFADGSELTADDVVYSILLHSKKGSKSGGKAYLTGLKSVEKMNKYQVKISYMDSSPDVPAVLSLYNFAIVKNGHTNWLKPNGTGGYNITTFKPGVRIVAERRNDYWRKDSAWADTFELIYINDVSSTINSLMSGSIDVCSGIPAILVKRLEKVSSLNVVKSEGKAHFTWAMMQTKAPFTDENVRKALKFGVDRQKIIDVALSGYGTVGNDNPISSAYADYVEQKQTALDTDKAKYYLKKAGMKTLDINLSVSDAAVGTSVESAGLVFKESAKASGINLTVVREPADGYWSNVWMKKPFHSSFWNGRPTASMMFDTSYISSSKWNEGEFKNKDFDALVKEAKATSSDPKRKQKLGEAQKILTEDGSVLIPAFRMTIEASSVKIGGHLEVKAQNINNTYFESLWIK